MDSRMHVEVEEQNSDWVGSAKRMGVRWVQTLGGQKGQEDFYCP
jgi:hypothetical protein